MGTENDIDRVGKVKDIFLKMCMLVEENISIQRDFGMVVMKTALREIRNGCSNGRCYSVWWSIMGREQEQLLNDKNSNVIYALSDSHHGYEAAIMTTIPQKWLLYMYMLYATKHSNYMVRKPRATGLSTVHLLDIEIMWYSWYVKGNGKRL